MSTIINADTSNGLKLTSDTSGEIELQSAGVTQAKVTSSGLQNASGDTITAQPGRNLLINGNMQIAQRATSVTGITSTSYNTCDRWRALITSGGTWTQSRSTDVPTGQGFERSLKMDVTSANTLAAADRVALQQRIEGFNLASVKKGTANAESLTLSFWVKCTSTGTFIAELGDLDNARNISATYTVDVINTWEKKTITFPADTTGEFDNNNAASLDCSFWLAAGSNYTTGTLQTPWATNVSADRAVGQTDLSSDTANDFYITGVQLEVGTVDTPFEYLQYKQQLELCQRYYFTFAGTLHGGDYSANGFVTGFFPTEMRATPTITYSAFRSPLAGSGFGYTKTQFFSGYMGASPYVQNLKADAEV